jgi:Mlc titration factor MtfA (ptsG expression regulator)
VEIVVALVLLLAFGGLLYLVLSGLWTFVICPLFGISPTDRPRAASSVLEDPEMVALLNDKFSYYRNLSPELRPLFVSRVRAFMDSQEFMGKDMEVTEEMKVLISASAIQVTFGLTKYRFDNFNKIIVFPREYQSHLDHRYHLGEVNLNGAIVLSWDDFKKGYFGNNDNYNVGLHEMAHALRFDKFRNGDCDAFFDGYFDKFLAEGKEEFLRIRDGENSFIRKYAGTNSEEFFAVCVEYFFESPLQMREKLPDLYRNLCILLNQDPSAPLSNGISIRPSLFKAGADNPGTLYFSSSLSYTRLIFPYVIGFLVVFFMFWNNARGAAGSNDSTAFFGIFSIVYIAAGGFTLSTKFKKFKIYENAFVVSYSLNPVIKDVVLTYDRIISATLSREESHYRNNLMKYSDFLDISYTDGTLIQSKQFSIDTIRRETMEKVAAFLKKEKVMIKIVGSGPWSHDSIDKEAGALRSTGALRSGLSSVARS